MRKYRAALFVCGLFTAGLFLGRFAHAGSIKVWTNEVLTAADLNANFSHIHNVMVGGHGARLVNSDVSATAAISHSKLATPALVAKAVGGPPTACTAAAPTTCAMSGTTNFSAMNKSATGVYTLTFTSPRPNTTYNVFVTAITATSQMCVTTTQSTTTVGINCYTTSTGAAADVAFAAAVFDDDN